MKKLQAAGLLSAMVLTGACQDKSAGSKSSVVPKTDDEKTFYTMGTLMGSRLKTINLTDREVGLVMAGVQDSAKGQERKDVNLAEYRTKVQTVIRKRMEKHSEKEKVAGQAYLDKFISSEGGTKSESGFAYKVLKAGTGSKPKSTDTVEVHYHGTLIDGTVFDSSVERKSKISFPLNRVIKCWTEGMQLVGVGGKIRLVCPSELAYGEHGAPPKIPGGATLVFDVELFSVKSGDDKKAAKSN